MAMGRLGLYLILLTLLAACSHLPVMKTLDPATDQSTMEVCGSPYVKIPYRFVHTIEATLPGGKTATLIGVTLVNPTGKTLHSVLMTLEGLVLFDGEYTNRTLSVNRAVSPFDQDSVARNMMEDVRLLFLAPEDPAVDAGVLKDGSTLCHRKGNEGESVDVLIQPDRTWKIETYINPFERLRTVTATSIAGGIPGELELKGNSYGNYTLRLKLLTAEPVSFENIPIEPGEETDDE
jgi:hypothetical protein